MSSTASILRHAGGGMFNALAELGAVRMRPPLDPRAASHRLAGALGTIARAHDLRISMTGNAPRGTALIVANHVGFLDPIALLPVCPALPVVAGEVARWPILGPLANALGVVYAKSGVRALRRIHDLLAMGVSVVNFAEGQARTGGEVGVMSRGSFGIAQRLDVPVIPVAISYTGAAIASARDYLRVASLPHVEISIAFGAPLQAQPDETPQWLAMRTRQAIFSLLHPGVATMSPVLDARIARAR